MLKTEQGAVPRLSWSGSRINIILCVSREMLLESIRSRTKCEAAELFSLPQRHLKVAQAYSVQRVALAVKDQNSQRPSPLPLLMEFARRDYIAFHARILCPPYVLL